MGSSESWRSRASSSRRLATARGSKGMAADPFRSPLLGEYRAAGALLSRRTREFVLLLLLRLQVAQQILDLVLALHRGEALFELRFAHLSSIGIRACLGDKHGLPCVTGRRSLVNAPADARDGA